MQILLNPGPVRTSAAVRTAASAPDISHRSPDFDSLLEGVRSKLTRALEADGHYSTVVVTGSGTAALDSAISSLSSRRRFVVISNGHYGEQLAEIAARYTSEYLHLRQPWASELDMGEIGRVISGYLETSESKHDVTVMAVHHETSTGMLNDIENVASIAKSLGCELLVDGVSSIGCETLRTGPWGIDWVIGSANKGIGGIAGVSFVVGRTSAFESLPSDGPNYYLDLAAAYRRQCVEGSVRFTPATAVLAAFDVALDELLDETIARRRTRFAGLRDRLRSGLLESGATLLLEERTSSSTMTVFKPAELSPRELFGQLYSENIVAYLAQGALSDDHLRMATMGELTADQVDTVIGAVLRFSG